MTIIERNQFGIASSTLLPSRSAGLAQQAAGPLNGLHDLLLETRTAKYGHILA